MPKKQSLFNAKAFLSTGGDGKEMIWFRRGQAIFAEGDRSDAVFVIREGRVRISARSQGGRKATLDILGADDFVGEDSLAGQPIRMLSASALTECKLLRIPRRAMQLALVQEATLSNALFAYVLARNIQYRQDLVYQRCNRTEKRLARILLLLYHFDGHPAAETPTPWISQETLAEMVGTTRSRVCHFISKFKRAGFIDYDLKRHSIRVRRSLLAFCTR